MSQQKKIDMKGKDKIHSVLRHSFSSSWIIWFYFQTLMLHEIFLTLFKEEHSAEVTFSLWHIASPREGEITEEFSV